MQIIKITDKYGKELYYDVSPAWLAELDLNSDYGNWRDELAEYQMVEQVGGYPHYASFVMGG